MDSSNGGRNGAVKKQEDTGDSSSNDPKGDKRDVKPVVKTLNRVPREFYRLHQLCSHSLTLIPLTQGACVRTIALADLSSAHVSPFCSECMSETENEM
jgi:hypothetical protein